MRNQILLGIVLTCICAFLWGCSTPKGGSSIPWNRPESWETQPNLNPGVRFCAS